MTETESVAVTTSLLTQLRHGPLRVCILGSGNWGSAVAKVVAENAKSSFILHDEVKMWVFEETLPDGRKLSEVINNDHENVKYLPGCKLPENLVAVPDLVETVKGCHVLVWNLPHQFLERTARTVRGHLLPEARSISCIKGLHISPEGRPVTLSTLIEAITGSPCDALSGANLAKDVASESFCETTIGYKPTEPEMALLWSQVFDRPYFRVNCLPDVDGVQVCGALKNVVAVSAGFVDGMGLGVNTKSAIIRIGIEEIRLFAQIFFDNVLGETFFDSAGYADTITTCFGGRNVKCAAEFVRRGGKATWEEIEADLLGGMKMQGQLTCNEVHQVLVGAGKQVLRSFPLFDVTYKVAFEGLNPAELINKFKAIDLRKIIDPSPRSAGSMDDALSPV